MGEFTVVAVSAIARMVTFAMMETVRVVMMMAVTMRRAVTMMSRPITRMVVLWSQSIIVPWDIVVGIDRSIASLN